MININKITGTKKASSLLNALHLNTSYGSTQNGALTFTRTESALLDFFAQAGAMRSKSKEALDLFKAAFIEDKEKAIRILFYLRDVRGGQGERLLFRNCLEWIGEEYPEVFTQIINMIPEYGRWDDMFFDHPKALEMIKKQLENDLKSDSPSLLAKWMPTINASSSTTKAKAKHFAKLLGMTEVQYRKTIRTIREKIATVEEKMAANKWSEIHYPSVPSQANRIYKNAFQKRDPERYTSHIQSVLEGKSKINASTLYPYQIYNSVQTNYSEALEALWKSLPDYTSDKNALVVADTSGSMTGTPMSVSVSLALYFAERNKGIFHNHFISFSAVPKLHSIKSSTLKGKMDSIQLGDVANTNISAVFDLILNTAIQNNIPKEEMPEVLYIISDMEFDQAVTGETNFQYFKREYENRGFILPSIVFWNVNASGSNLPVRANEGNVSLVSGCSPAIFKMAVSGKTPFETMMETINSPRYSNIIIK